MNSSASNVASQFPLHWKRKSSISQGTPRSRGTPRSGRTVKFSLLFSSVSITEPKHRKGWICSTFESCSWDRQSRSFHPPVRWVWRAEQQEEIQCVTCGAPWPHEGRRLRFFNRVFVEAFEERFRYQPSPMLPPPLHHPGSHVDSVLRCQSRLVPSTPLTTSRDPDSNRCPEECTPWPATRCR